VRFLYTDNGYTDNAGITRAKATHVDGLAHRLIDGIGLTVAMQAMNMLDQLQVGYLPLAVDGTFTSRSTLPWRRAP